MPLWLLGSAAFAVMFWLFVLLPSWVNANADVIEHGDGVIR